MCFARRERGGWTNTQTEAAAGKHVLEGACGRRTWSEKETGGLGLNPLFLGGFGKQLRDGGRASHKCP